MSKLRAGVVGLGWAGEQHMAGYVAHPDVELVAIAGPELDKGEVLASKYGVEHHADWATMLHSAELDVISIATPTAMHAAMSIAALEAGVHVLTEKPMAANAADAALMVRAAEENDRVLEVMFNQRRRGGVKTLTKLVADGELGEIYYAKAGWVRRTGIPGLGSWFTRKELAGGGPLMDIGIHCLDMALSIMGNPTPRSVMANTYAKFGNRGLGNADPQSAAKFGSDGTTFEVEDLGTAFITMEDGATLILESSWAQYVERDSLYVTVYGTEGSAHLDCEMPPWTKSDSLTVINDLNSRTGPVEVEIAESDGHSEAVADFITAIQSGDWAEYRGQHPLARAVIVDAAYDSAETHTLSVLDE